MSSLSQAPPVGYMSSPHGAFQEHAAHPPEWSGSLAPRAHRVPVYPRSCDILTVRFHGALLQRQRQGACEHPTSCCVATRGRGSDRDQSFLSETSTSRFLIKMNETPCRLSRNLAAPEYLCLVDVTDFCTDGDGVIAHVGSYANNGRFLLVLRECSDTGQFADFA